ncbi:RNA polymerase sigma factor [Hymenobacter weizhouensis]|uniref:RNA polymerase sigma factor n=1 Tax=Hymenobacter sp. YIM 151500-1 TaxID=2987689 RepID=UPI002226D0D6|nr:sigma-70 family RNA polymerase sigma factor [Hymenobacter sp. YIM 151500-1]UYZ62400.1 sigma-70 family RNA polymerase sigma factor [Hymenobacter sp. YIM 151500-1]
MSSLSPLNRPNNTHRKPDWLTMLPSDDAKLWDDFRGGNEQAFTRIFLTHYDALFSYGLKLAADEELVKDCIQTLFQKLWRRRDGLGPVALIKPYLYKALRRTIGDETKLLRRHRLLLPAYSDEFDITYSHEDFLVAQQYSQEQSGRLLAVLNRLSRRQREAIYLKFFDGFSYEKISEIMGLNLQSVRNLVHQALKALKKALLLSLLVLYYT